VTLEAIAAALDQIAVDMANALMPPHRGASVIDDAQYAYALGLATAAVKQRADQLRKFAGVADG
jgi:hypothetical protein